MSTTFSFLVGFKSFIRTYQKYFANSYNHGSQIYVMNTFFIFSGTTGLSKGVKLSHKNIVSNSMMINSDTGNGQVTYAALGNHQDVLPCILPFFHIYGLTCTLLSKLAHGCKLITLPKFAPDTYLNTLEKHKGTVLYLVPPISE